MKIGLIGCGKMGSALISGALNAGLEAEIQAFDPVEAALTQLASSHASVRPVRSNAEVLNGASAVLLCVKPQSMGDLLQEIGESKSPCLFISIAAGISLAQLENGLGSDHRVVRVMPNTPALIGKGAAGFTLGKHATREDRDLTLQLLSGTGLAEEVPETLMDAVTGLSGSGPAYIFTVIEALADGGVRQGLPRDKAVQLAAQTVSGAAEMVLQTGTHPAVLRDQVTSPGGTTIAGLAALEERGLRSALIEAVAAAARRSVELGAD